MFTFLDLHRLLAVIALLNLVVLAPKVIGRRLVRRETQDVIRPGEGQAKLDVGVLPTNITSCAQTCILTSYVGSSVGCVHDDFTCICKSQSFLNSTLACYAASCPPSDGSFAGAWVSKACASLGVNVTDIINIAMHPNGTHVSSHAQNSTQTVVSANAKKSAGNLLSLTKTSASLLVGAGLVTLLIQSI